MISFKDLLEPIQQIFIVTTSLITLASAITAITNTPSKAKKGTVLRMFYRLIEFLALVTNKTKQK